MTQRENNQINLIEVLAILLMSVQTVLLEQDIEAQLRKAREAKDREREREARETLHNVKPDPEKAKDHARSVLTPSVAEAVSAEVDNVAPKLQRRPIPGKRSHAHEHLGAAVRVSNGLVPEDDRRYAAAKAYAKRCITPPTRRVSLEQLAGTVSHRHEYDGPDF